MDEKTRRFQIMLRSSFPAFLKLGLLYKRRGGKPLRVGKVQLRMAEFFQSPGRKKKLLGFRGISKTTVIGYYCAFRWNRFPATRIQILSGTAGKAALMGGQILSIMKETPWLRHLWPGNNASGAAFNIPGQRDAEGTPSLLCAGIDGTLTSGRAHLIIADDTETPQNSETPMMREKLLDRYDQFDSLLHPAGELSERMLGIILPGEETQVLMPGTPQTERSTLLEDAPIGHPLYAMKTLMIPCFDEHGESVFPERISTKELIQKSKGMRTGAWHLQFLLNKDHLLGQNKPLESKFIHYIRRNLGTTDVFVDPGGDGSDEWGYLAGDVIDGKAHLKRWTGLEIRSENAVKKIVEMAIADHAHVIHVETNLSMVGQLLEREIQSRPGCLIGVNGFISTKNKLKRILMTEPFVRNRMVTTQNPLEKATVEQMEDLRYDELPERDDRLDVLAFALIHWKDRLSGGVQIYTDEDLAALDIDQLVA